MSSPSNAINAGYPIKPGQQTPIATQPEVAPQDTIPAAPSESTQNNPEVEPVRFGQITEVQGQPETGEDTDKPNLDLSFQVVDGQTPVNVEQQQRYDEALIAQQAATASTLHTIPGYNTPYRHTCGLEDLTKEYNEDISKLRTRLRTQTNNGEFEGIRSHTFGSALPYQRVDGNEILYKDLVSKLSIALTSLSITTSTRERLRYVNEINELNHKIGLLLENFF